MEKNNIENKERRAPRNPIVILQIEIQLHSLQQSCSYAKNNIEINLWHEALPCSPAYFKQVGRGFKTKTKAIKQTGKQQQQQGNTLKWDAV